MTAALHDLSSQDSADLLRLLEKIVTSMKIGGERAAMMFEESGPETTRARRKR